MLQRILFIIICGICLPTIVLAETNEQIEVFDCQKQMVIEKHSLRIDIQEEAIKYAQSITGLFTNLNAVPKTGHMIKVPLSSQVVIQNRWIHTHIDEVVILLPEAEQPYIMIYDDENNPHFFYVKGNPETLLGVLLSKRTNIIQNLRMLESGEL